MGWDAIGAIGQVFGSVAVFITLGYLAVQVRHAQEQGKRALSQARFQSLHEITALMCDDRINRIQAKAQHALGTASPPHLSAFIEVMERAGVTNEEAVVVARIQNHVLELPHPDNSVHC